MCARPLGRGTHAPRRTTTASKPSPRATDGPAFVKAVCRLAGRLAVGALDQDQDGKRQGTIVNAMGRGGFAPGPASGTGGQPSRVGTGAPGTKVGSHQQGRATGRSSPPRLHRKAKTRIRPIPVLPAGHVPYRGVTGRRTEPVEGPATVALRLVGSCQGSTKGAPRWPRGRG